MQWLGLVLGPMHRTLNTVEYIKKKITNVSQHHGFLRSESLFSKNVNNSPAFDLMRTVDSDPWV